MNPIQFTIGAIFIVIGLVMEALAIFGIYRFTFCLNRMHSGAMGDTLGIGNIVIGICIMSGLSVTTLKLITVCFFFWLAGPVASHLLVRLEVTTNEHIDQYAKKIKEEEA